VTNLPNKQVTTE